MEPPLGQAGWDRYWRDCPELAGKLTSVDAAVLRVLQEWCGPLQSRSLLEAGSGSGKISRVLALEGARTCLVDLSNQAIRLSRESFRQKGALGSFLRASILQFPFGDNCFDIVWNEGVVEHFDANTRKQIVGEMARVCRQGGWVVTFAPYAGAHLYRLGKWYAERRGTWAFGREEPLPTMEPEFLAAGLTVAREETIGFWGQVHFLSYIPVVRVIPRLTAWMESGLGVLDRFLPGYFLVTAARKG
ncbi:MAG: class I SAM-dependent methyltransferase [Candidatus Eisenbacteria sp.]|nr:class I SAM-dependent methyltransferase [Candidatus Eisenbacteria bacterium]